MALLIGAIGVFAAFWLLLWYIRIDTLKRGELTVANKTLDKALDDVKDANAIHDKLKSDPDYASGVRSRFERD